MRYSCSEVEMPRDGIVWVLSNKGTLGGFLDSDSETIRSLATSLVKGLLDAWRDLEERAVCWRLSFLVRFGHQRKCMWRSCLGWPCRSGTGSHQPRECVTLQQRRVGILLPQRQGQKYRVPVGVPSFVLRNA